jgi:hypothetical protein
MECVCIEHLTLQKPVTNCREERGARPHQGTSRLMRISDAATTNVQATGL